MYAPVAGSTAGPRATGTQRAPCCGYSALITGIVMLYALFLFLMSLAELSVDGPTKSFSAFTLKWIYIGYLGCTGIAFLVAFVYVWVTAKKTIVKQFSHHDVGMYFVATMFAVSNVVQATHYDAEPTTDYVNGWSRQIYFHSMQVVAMVGAMVVFSLGITAVARARAHSS